LEIRPFLVALAVLAVENDLVALQRKFAKDAMPG
jgi:hypothetical protein